MEFRVHRHSNTASNELGLFDLLLAIRVTIWSIFLVIGGLQLHSIVLYCIVLYCIVLYCIIIYCILLYCTLLYCIALNCIILYCIILYGIELSCIALYYIVLKSHMLFLHYACSIGKNFSKYLIYKYEFKIF